MHTATITYEITAIVRRASSPEAYLLPGGQGWALPRRQTTEPHFWQAVDCLNPAIAELIGMPVTTLRCLSTEYQADRERIASCYELEALEAGAPAGRGRRLGPECLPWLASDEQRVLLQRWFAEAAADTPACRRAWARPGWLATAESWIDAHVVQLGLQRCGPLQQLRTWERGCVIRIPASDGDLYFKALPPMFGHEIPLLQALAASHPANMVRLLAADHERGWMLMPDMSGRTLDQVPDLARWQEALRQFARVQMTTARSPAAMLALGCPDCRLKTLAGQIDPFFATLAKYPRLSADEIGRLRSLGPPLKNELAALASYNIPAAVEHGDFWPGNVMAAGDSYVFFDWTDCTLAHPFFSLSLFLELDGISTALPMESRTTAHLRDAYLEPWLAHEPWNRLLEAFALARQLGPLHLALHYHRTILPNMEARWEMENMVAFYLKMLLRE